MSANPLSKTVRGATKNCTAKNGPESCRYHSSQFRVTPLAEKYKSFSDVFERVDKEFEPSMIVHSLYADLEERSQAELEFGRKHSQNMEAKLTSEELWAVHSYTDEYGSNRIRTVLNNPKTIYSFNGESMESIQRKISLLDSAFEKAQESTEGTILWRGVTSLEHELEGIQEGSVVEYKTYTSTSIDSEVAVGFATIGHPILMKIHAKKGLYMASQHISEQEVLLARGGKFQVVGIHENAHIEKVDMSFGKDPLLRGVTLIELQEL